mmetsp:Transcript_112861/g.283865  ORF Transcript_112861/g.283865 Transcript_112861/m.283865 type:complete len:191 (+) Transcript_112861:3-575(+)
MLAGFALGISRWVLNSEATCGDKDVGSFYCMDFNHMVLIIFAVASAVTIVVSLLTVRPLETQLQGTCATAAATTGTAVGCSGLSALDPMHRRMLLDSGELLLAIMLVLCVGFGYSAEPTRFFYGIASSKVLMRVVKKTGRTRGCRLDSQRSRSLEVPFTSPASWARSAPGRRDRWALIECGTAPIQSVTL